MNFKKLKMTGLTLALSGMLLFGSSMSVFANTPDNIDTTGTTETTTEVTEEEGDAEENVNESTEETSGDETEEGRVTGETENGVLTPTGNLSLQDNITGEEADNMDFMTVTSKDGHTFYIVIDHNGTTDNVYFLNQVDETDLMALMSEEEKAQFETEDEEKVEEAVTPTVNTDSTEEAVPEEEERNEQQGLSDSLNTNLVLAIVFGIVAVLCFGGYFVLTKKARKNNASLADDLEFYDDEEYENEDEEEPEFDSEDEEEDVNE